MSVHSARVAALLAWVNSTNVCPDRLNDLSQLQDCSVFIRIIHKIHRSKEGESVLEQPLPERISFIRGFLQKHCRDKYAMENLVSAQKLLDGEELALAKVAVLLLYHTSMSSRNPGDWNEFDYKTQVELASILKFVLDNEECLNENLEPFLQRREPPSSSVSSSSFEERSPLFSLPPKQEVRFLELQRIASFPSSNLVGLLHEAFRQCQDLKTEKAQMDRKINQLSEEIGTLSFKLREFASNMVQLQRAHDELLEEHNTAMAQFQEKQRQLEKDLHAALQDKKCSEEKTEILPGEISMLEDQLAKLEECSTQEKGEVMGDILKSKKPTSCFPRPQTTQDRSEQSGSQVSQESKQPAPATQAQRHQLMAFSILNTTRPLGRRLLGRAVTRKNTSTPSSSSGTRRLSP
ncbi:nuclear mitotic apparatus protein 1-like isoform X3 [Poecile atricapillus]|uniref:nuclear mitotic apparatus protein 1-like isoform X3 n=1 Tax=Poecile atricapillus TaxID=48891 RepID=UPI0027393B8E|nr:nuclear mitotic apparatus protein 1-like isoform X3 [Poecile atricapillus]